MYTNLRMTVQKYIANETALWDGKAAGLQSLFPVGELLMAAGQLLLSLFSCPIYRFSEKTTKECLKGEEGSDLSQALRALIEPHNQLIL